MTAGGGRVKTILKFAAEHGIRVHAAHLEPGVLGEWYADTREIYYDIGLTPDEAVCTVAHELGHAHHGHHCEGNPSDEQQADEYAAALLINPQILAHLERLGLSRHDIAEELRVSEDLLDTFLDRWVTKLRGVSYVRSRIGTGAWAYRIEVA